MPRLVAHCDGSTTVSYDSRFLAGSCDPHITEHFPFAEENPAASKVFFRETVIFRVLTVLPGLAGLMVLQCHNFICSIAGETDKSGGA